MAAPRLKGLHHIKLPVTDLDTSLNWYRRVFDAEHLARFDHYDGAGTRYAVILQLPGVDIPIELRWAPDAAAATVGYHPRPPFFRRGPRGPPRECASRAPPHP